MRPLLIGYLIGVTLAALVVIPLIIAFRLPVIPAALLGVVTGFVFVFVAQQRLRRRR